MERQIFRDTFGRQLGIIETDLNGMQTARDNGGRQLATYDSRDNTTRDNGGRILVRGNALASFIYGNGI